MKQDENDSTMGMVTSRECPLCGHHEIGFITQDGEFHSLRSGTYIRILEAPSSPGPAGNRPASSFPTDPVEEAGNRPWIPEPLQGDRALRRKYGVMAKGHLFKSGMSGELYELAFQEKLERLVEKTLDVPLPVILDRFFNAPHLASGNARQIAEAMYRELDEIKQPVRLLQNWLERREDRSLVELVKPKTLETLGQEPADEETVRKELETLSLEQFLELL